MKIIINTPKTTIPAGVSNHYLGLRPYFSNNVIYNQYLPGHYIKEKTTYWLVFLVKLITNKFFEILRFLYLIIRYKKPTILLNPSFGKSAIQRDALFLRISKFFGCKVAVFMHGWDKTYLEKVLNKEVQFSNAWFKANAFFVLANEFKEYLEKLNIRAPIHLTSTKVNDQLLEGVPTKSIKQIKTILFLARIEKAKGIFTTIDAFQILTRKHPEMRLQIVGRGNALNEAKKYAKQKNIANINFKGPFSGDALKSEFINADLYILPTTHGEGMPTSVLEAMAFGLPVITRPVGGLIDFFDNGKMGYLIESLNPKEYAEKIELLIKDVNKANHISKYNSKFAKEHFLASKIAPEIEKIIKEI